MCASSTLIGIWATGVWLDLGAPTNVSALTISGYAVQPSTLGRLNSSIGSCYSGSGYAGPGTVNYDVVPALTCQELGLIDLMYRSSYYNGLVQANMGYGGDSRPFMAVAEGDTRISYSNPATIGAVYAKMAQDAQSRLWQYINAYNANSNAYAPRQVLLYDIIYPAYSSAYWANP